MDSTPMPEPLRRAVHQYVAEAVFNCFEVLRYTEPDVAHDWKRMTLYRSTDAADVLTMASMLIAAHCERTGMAPDTLRYYLQTDYQKSRADAREMNRARAQVAGLLGEPAPEGDDRVLAMRYAQGQHRAEDALTPEDDPQKPLTAACLYGLSAKLCDDVDALNSYLSPQMAAMARKVADALEIPQPATL
ncbi:hypothetical protein ACWV95_36575 [Streptomyces albus]